jgi:hypothetical protein
MKANEMHYFSYLFVKVLYMFRTSLLSIIRCISTLYIRNRYLYLSFYKMSIMSSPDYKHLLQENYVEYKYIFLPLLKLVSKIELKVELHFEKKNVFIPLSFIVINVCNQGKTLCSPCSTVGVC